MVVVRKKNDKWRVCFDDTHLNDACLKDTFPLPRIDQIVDAIVGHELLSFLNTYSSYNQISMYSFDEAKTAFIIPYNMYYYRVMLFRLKNIEATYQCMMSRVFEPLLGKTVAFYINDILIKSNA